MAKAVRKYHSLFERQTDGSWAVQFGDYSRAIVVQERFDTHYSAPYTKLKDLKIVTHDENIDQREVAKTL
jgi:hypothetical protein